MFNKLVYAIYNIVIRPKCQQQKKELRQNPASVPARILILKTKVQLVLHQIQSQSI